MKKNAVMSKNALVLNVYVLAAGAFGVFFRWLQNQTAFNEETGLNEGGFINWLVPIVLIAAAVLFYSLVKKFFAKGYVAPADVYKCFSSNFVAYPIAYWVTAALLIVGGASAMLSDYEIAGGMFKLVGFLAILSGVGVPIVCSCARRVYSPGMVCTFMTFPIATYVFWLIASYRLNSSEPAIASYAVEILMICVVLIALYYLAGFAYSTPEAEKTMFFLMLGAFFCITSLADSRSFGQQLIVLGTAAMLILSNWMLIVSCKEGGETPPETPEKKPEEQKEPESDDEVIEPGTAEIESGDTIEAPDFGAKKKK